MAVGDARGGVRLVDVLDAASVAARVEGHTGAVTALAFGDDGRSLLSGGADGRLLAWTTVPLRRAGALPTLHSGPIAAIATTFDGDVWLTTDLTGSLRSWNVVERSVRAGFARSPSPAAVRDAVAASGIPVLASAVAGHDHVAAIAHRAWSAALAAHPTRNLVVVGVQDGVAVLDAATLERVWTAQDGAGDTAGVAFTADGAAVVSVSESGTVRRWAFPSDDAPTRWASGVSGVRALAAGDTADRVLIGTAHGAAVWLDLATGRPIEPALRGHGADVTGLVVADGLAVTASNDGRVVAWDRSHGHGFGVLVGASGWAPRALAIDETGTYAYVGSQDGTFTRLSLTDPEAPTTVVPAHEGGVTGAAFAKGLLATVGRDGRLVVRDPVTLAPMATTFVHDDPLWSIAFDGQDDAWVVGGVREIVARVPWDAAETPMTLHRPTRGWGPGAVVAHHDVDTWAVAFEERIELRRGGVVVGNVDQLTRAPVQTLSFDATGQRLLAASGSLVTLWSVPSLELVASWPTAGSAAFSPDGSLIALGEHGDGIRLIDGATLDPIGLPFRGHTSMPSRLAFTPDGRWLVAADDRGDVRVWPTHADAWLDAACALAWQDLRAEEITALLGEHAFESPCEVDRG